MAVAPTIDEARHGSGFRPGFQVHRERILDSIREIAHPRLTGTPGEVRAARTVLRWFRAGGLVAHRERFPVPFAAREAASSLCFLACLALAFAGLELLPSAPLFAALAWALAAWGVHAPWRLKNFLTDRVSTRLRSRNVVATLSDDQAHDAPCRVVFMAHYDSKSQILPTGLRVALVAGSSGICWALAALGGVVATGRVSLPSALMPTLTVLAIAAFALLAANRTGNRSPGALDNGSGLAVLAELARSWRPDPDHPAEVHWVATGAEELGLDGSRAFLARHEWWWRDKPTLLINLDSVGSGSVLRLSGEPSALLLAERAASDLDLPTRRFSVVGAGMDHEPFAALGLPSLTILGDVFATSFRFHTPGDTLSLIDPAALARSYSLTSHLASLFCSLHATEPGPVYEPALAIPQ
jgi:hypothetical protein